MLTFGVTIREGRAQPDTVEKSIDHVLRLVREHGVVRARTVPLRSRSGAQ